MKKHINIPIFIPHMGCPHNCIFCNQVKISGHSRPDFENIKNEIENALATTDPKKQEIQLAYFGGSFTGIDRDDLEYLLKLGKSYIDSGKIDSMRCSTRPDYINEDIIGLLKENGMKTVELGVQSCSDEVLRINERGHTSEQSERAAKLIVSSGMQFVGQMMIGLPGSDEEKEIATATRISEWGASASRIYPCVVLKNTKLAEMTKEGRYVPLTITEAAERSEKAFEVFLNHGVDVIRIGLQSTDNLTDGSDIAFGEYSETIGEMCLSIYFEKLLRKNVSRECCKGKILEVLVNPKRVSSVSGYRKVNKNRIIEEFSLIDMKIKGCSGIGEFDMRTTITGR